jgi:putative tricarboxylic transport membrane protein
VLLAMIVAWETSLIPGEVTYARVGPQAFPWAVSMLMGCLGAFLAAEAFLGWRAEDVQESEQHGALNLTGALYMLLGLILNVALIDVLGFILASTALFVCTARAFNSKQPLRDTAIGFALALVAYVGFDRILGYKIGSGIIESLI